MTRYETPHRRSAASLLGGLAAACLAIVTLATPAAAQDGREGAEQRESPLDGVQPVTSVDVLSPRVDGPAFLVMFIEREKLLPAPGTYRTQDGKSLRINEHGQIVELTAPEADARRLRVVAVDAVAARADDGPPRIVLQDRDRRSIALPDGRYVSDREAVLVVRDGAVVGYGGGR
ncbi:MAG: hypothetical protein ACODAA_00010 [Gemmatimonadota bacterium]